MAIALGTALLGSAILGAGASVAGAAANSQGINRATDATTRYNEQSLALQQENKNFSNALLMPYSQRGNAAGDQINALLGLPTAAQAPGGATAPDWGSYLQQNPDVMQGYYTSADRSQFQTPEQYAQWHYGNYGQGEGRAFPSAPGAASGTTPASATNAFDSYLNSAGYKFQLGEANKGANAGFAAAGALDSGAAVKASQDRAQNMSGGFFNNYLALLGGQQQTGLAGASAVAGVGQNFANNATNINTSTANALGQGAMAKANNTNSLLGNLSSSFGLGMGALSKFGGGSPYGGTLGAIY